MTPGEVTLTASDIARLANVGRAAVSNWRRRYADFPTPVGGTPASPSFDAREVADWLRQHGRLHQASTEQWAWRHIESHQPATQISDVLGICGAYLLVRSDQTDTAGDTMLSPAQLVDHLRTLDPGLTALVDTVLPPVWTAQLTTVLTMVDQLGAEQGHETAFEYLHSRYVASANSLSGLAGTPDSIAETMLTLAGSGARMFDFTSGTGSILRMAADQALTNRAPTRCYAQEIKPQYALITLLRLWFVHLRARRAGIEVEPPVVHVGDSLLADAMPDLRADVVVANFPFGIHDWGHDRLAYDPRWTYGLPPRTEPELAWVQHALAHLSPDGAVVVLMPPAAAVRPAGRRVRAELVRRGALRAIIALPAGLMPPTGIGLHVWVLGQPDPTQPRAGELLVVDTTAAPADQSLPDIVGTAWRAYRSGRYDEVPSIHRAIPVIEVLDDQVDLTPQRYLAKAGELAPDPGQTIARIGEFEQLLDQVRGTLPAVRQLNSSALRTAPQADIADLIRSRSISVQRPLSRSRSTGTTATTTVLTATDALSGGPATGSAPRNTNNDPASRVRANDILITILGRNITAQVATPDQAGAELGPGVQLMRVDTTRFDPWFIAGVISRTDNPHGADRTTSTSNGALRIEIRRLTIPVLPLDQQRPYGQAFRQLIEFRNHLDRAGTTGAALAREISDGLTLGSLGPSS
ncbi:HsdM family class I SAM-dependent methyltransferase [Micromonospora sp. NBC_01796]|uniref:HsdM family class I SAM-dependent methyltransferase n=1 Tax=Micromonospora sp. NBC_01796 TaxID=2975987 RepID=UPI002DDA28CC|nr:N-6 DNA methylase [Micromonospora sp. NBC_01796]WSA83867.1 SAM-dependent methyltransferase [Micromonospora sp. NBC_01796]